MSVKVNVRVLSAISAFASKEETRYYLNGVFLEIEPRAISYVATDGHRLVVFREDLTEDDPDNDEVGSYIVPTAQCRAYKPSKQSDGFGQLAVEDDRLTIAFDGVDLTFAPIDGTFPDWRRVVPPAPTTGEHGHFNFEYLSDFIKFAKSLSLPLPNIVPNGLDKPALVLFGSEMQTFGVLMPMRGIEISGRQPPAWALASAEKQAA